MFSSGLSAADKNRERKGRKTQSNYTDSFHKQEVVMSPLHFQGEFTKNVISDYNCSLLKLARDFKLTQAQLQEISYAQEQNQETSCAQVQLQEKSIQTELQRNLFEVEHLIHNCGVHNTNQIQTLKTRISKI
jgi:hypothetical protein